MIEVFGTIAAVCAVAGVIFNNRKVRVCFLLWMISNMVCANVHAVAGLWSLYWRDVLFFIFAIEGYYKWGKKQGGKK